MLSRLIKSAEGNYDVLGRTWPGPFVCIVWPLPPSMSEPLDFDTQSFFELRIAPRNGLDVRIAGVRFLAVGGLRGLP